MKRKRTIVYIINSLKIGGPVNMLYNLAKYMEKERFDIVIIALHKCPEKSKKNFEDIDCKVIELPKSNILQMHKKVRALLSKLKPDIVHSHGGIADMVNTFVKGQHSRFSTVHCFPDEDFVMKKGKLLGMLKANIFMHTMKKIEYPIACSDTVSRKLLNKRNFNCTAIKNGIDFEVVKSFSDNTSRKQLGIPADKIVLVFCGYLSNRKNVSFLFDAFQSVKRKDLNLVILGDGKEYATLKERAKQDNRILMVGRVDNAFDYLKCGDYIVSASLSEGLPLAVMEGMACGLPAILSNIDSHHELLNLCPKGVKLFNLNSFEELKIIFEELNKDNYQIEKEAALQVIEKELNSLRMASEYSDLYIKSS